ncbi:MAG: hypothetical protein AAGF12_13095 [Myxococcota bacterium]
MENSRRLSLIVIAVLVATPACAFDEEGGGFGSPLTASNPELRGGVGDVQVSSGAWVEHAYTYDGEAYIDLRARGREGVVMQGLDIYPLDELEIGDSYVADILGRYDDGESYAYVSVMGCSGPRNDDWYYYDSLADEVKVTVHPGPTADTVRVNTTATFVNDFDGSTETVDASIVIAPNQR